MNLCASTLGSMLYQIQSFICLFQPALRVLTVFSKDMKVQLFEQHSFPYIVLLHTFEDQTLFYGWGNPGTVQRLTNLSLQHVQGVAC